MAHYSIRCNLVSATFPFYTEGWGRSVIVPQIDFNYDRQAAAAIADNDKDKGIPQLFYAHNVMPTTQGAQAIGFNEIWPGLFEVTDFDQAFPFYTASRNRFIFVPAAGKNYIANANTGVWQSVSPLAPGTVADNVLLTVAYVKEQTYFCYAGNGIYIYDDTANTFVPQTFTAGSFITPADVLCICEAGGYLIAVTLNGEVYWSSLNDPLDFEPSLETGSSSTYVSEAKGKASFCLSISGGFMIYYEGNVVSATYTGNIQFPFVFKQVNGAGIVAGPEHVSWQAGTAEHYVWSNTGLQRLTRIESVNIFPEASDFLAAKIYEDFDEDTLTLSSQYLDTNLFVNLHFVTSRYMVVSYGTDPNTFSFALIYDLSLKRWGKIKLEHRDVFQWNFPNMYGEVTYDMLEELTYDALYDTTYDELGSRVRNQAIVKESIAFLLQDGTVKILDFSLGNSAASGVLIAGKYQLLRAEWIIHLESEVEVVNTADDFQYYLLPSLDGKTLLPAVAPMLVKNSAKLRKYMRKYTAQNFSSLFVGAFNLVSFQISVTKGGSR